MQTSAAIVLPCHWLFFSEDVKRFWKAVCHFFCHFTKFLSPHPSAQLCFMKCESRWKDVVNAFDLSLKSQEIVTIHRFWGARLPFLISWIKHLCFLHLRLRAERLVFDSLQVQRFGVFVTTSRWTLTQSASCPFRISDSYRLVNGAESPPPSYEVKMHGVLFYLPFNAFNI